MSAAALRLDQRMVAEGLAPSRAKAQALVAAGVVTVDGKVVAKPGLKATGVIAVTADPCPWVSRAALKLVHALDHFGLHPAGAALDLGASTGGFTEVLLARGSARVFAVDVGHGQMNETLRADPRVTCIEGYNARDLPHPDIGQVDWITADLSFVSLTKVLPAAISHAAPGAHLVALVKPQFEAGPAHVGKGGIVSDPEVHASVLADARACVAGLGWETLGHADSPILGGDGNREFLLAARRRA